MEESIAKFNKERDELVSLCKQLNEDSMINNRVEGLLRGLVRDVDPVIKKNKVIKDEMRKRCGDLEVRIQKVEELINGKK